jgi:septal ring factor EnvC (AmiA/AmiB activator)
MNIFKESLSILIASAIVCSVFFVVHCSDTRRINEQSKQIERLQGEIQAVTSAFKEISLELTKAQYAYASWSNEIEKLRNVRHAKPETIREGHMRSQKTKTKGKIE